jgi:hypothetical protein
MQVLKKIERDFKLIFSKVLDKPNSLRMFATSFGSFNKSINFVFLYFSLLESYLTVIINDVVDDKGVTLINGAIDGQL